MEKVITLYNLVIDTVDKGSYYVGCSSVGGGYYEFYFGREPIMNTVNVDIVQEYKNLLKIVLDDNGGTYRKGDYFSIGEDFDYRNIINVTIQKQTIITKTIYEYLD